MLSLLSNFVKPLVIILVNEGLVSMYTSCLIIAPLRHDTALPCMFHDVLTSFYSLLRSCTRQLENEYNPDLVYSVYLID